MSDEFNNDGYDPEKDNADNEPEKEVQTEQAEQREEYKAPERNPYMYTQNDTQETQTQPKKKSHVARNIGIGAAACVAVALMGTGVYHLVDSFTGDKDKNQTVASNDDAAEKETKKAKLIVADDDTDTEETDKADTKVTEAQTDDDRAETSQATQTAISESTTIETTDKVSASILDVSDIVEEVMPSVVAVTNNIVYKVTSSNWSWYGNSSDYEYPASGAGSGVIIGENDTELLIVTNAHVVIPTDYSSYGYSVDSSDISIQFCNDESVDAYIKGYDEDADLAVVGVALEDIDADTLNEIKIATVGNSDELQAGNGVIAIGNALGYGQSVTVGYVSALNREVTIDDVTRTLLQTDAAINPGNSGGGLFNTDGELIGINSAKYTSEDVEGIGYAIPITSATDTIEELMNSTTVIREKVEDEDKQCYLGIYSSKEYSSSYGVLIGDVVSGGPADEAGLQSYDIITAIDDKQVSSWSELVDALEYYEGGEQVTITYYTIEGSGRDREYVEKTATVTLGFKKDAEDTDSTDDSSDSSSDSKKSGGLVIRGN